MSDAMPPPARRSRVLPAILLIILIFAGGAAFWAWASQNWFQIASPTPPPVLPSAESVSESASPQIGLRPVGSVGVNDVAALSERVRALESGSASTANAGSSISTAAERLILILAIRKAAERGISHEPTAQALRQLFPAQTATLLPAITQNASNPAGVAALVQEFGALKQKMSGSAGSWLDQFSRLAVIRSRSVENPTPTDLVAQAELAVQREDFALAARLIRQHPSRAEAAPWIERATKHAAVTRALDSLEALVLETPTVGVPALKIPAIPAPPPSAQQPIAAPRTDQETPPANPQDI